MKTYHWLIFLSLCAWPAVSTGQMLSDEDYEKQLNKIYLKYYRQPVSLGDWRFRTQNLPPEIELKFKDNFWDLSRSLFNNPLYWSKLWTANPSVENPHRINQGSSIKFNPSFVSASGLSPQDPLVLAQISGLSIPENEMAHRALTEWEIPASLPHLLEFRPTISNEIDFSALKPVDVSMQVVLPFYLDSKTPPSVGKVVSKDGYGRLTAFSGEQLVVRLDDSTSIGSVFTIFEDRGRVGSWFAFLEAGNENIEIMIKGRIKIVSRLPSEDFVYLAVVEESLQAISAGDSLFAGPPPVYNSSQKGPQGTGEGLIIGGSSRQIMMSVGSIVYLNKGQEDGLEKNHLFYIFGNQKTIGNTPPRPYKYDLPILGKLKVIRVGLNSATAFITESRDQIYAGDMFAGDPDQLENLNIYLDYEEVETTTDTEQQKEDFLLDMDEDFDEDSPENEELDENTADSEMDLFESDEEDLPPDSTGDDNLPLEEESLQSKDPSLNDEPISEDSPLNDEPIDDTQEVEFFPDDEDLPPDSTSDDDLSLEEESLQSKDSPLNDEPIPLTGPEKDTKTSEENRESEAFIDSNNETSEKGSSLEQEEDSEENAGQAEVSGESELSDDETLVDDNLSFNEDMEEDSILDPETALPEE